MRDLTRTDLMIAARPSTNATVAVRRGTETILLFLLVCALWGLIIYTALIAVN